MLDFIRYATTFFVLILVPIYWVHYGPQNFLWLSDVGLFLTLGGTWFQSSLLISMAALAILPLELFWNIDFFMHLCTGSSMVGGLTNYMFDANLPLYLRGISLFHVFLPMVWFFLLYKWGYDPRGWVYGTALYVLVLSATYFLPEPFENINFVFTPTFHNLSWISPLGWFIGQLVLIPVLVFWPMHQILKYLFAIK